MKTGSGAQTFSGANTYTGSTTVSGGGLYVNGSLASGGTVNVSAGAVLGGTGSAGNTYVAAGGDIDIHADGAGTLTLSSLKFSGSGTISLPALSSTSSLALQTGSLSASGGSGSLLLSLPSTPAGNGLYRLIAYSGSIGGTGFGALTVNDPGLASRQSGVLVNNSNEVDFNLTTGTLYWNGQRPTGGTAMPGRCSQAGP